MNRFIAASTGLLTLAGGAGSTAAAQEPHRNQDYVVVEPGYRQPYYDDRYDRRYDERVPPTPPPPSYYRARGYHGRQHGGDVTYEAVRAARALADHANHLAEAASAAGFDPRMIRDAYEFADQASYFARLVVTARDPYTIERDFHALARDYQRLRSNFGRFGYGGQGRHLEEDFEEVRQAFHYTADALRGAYAYDYRYYRGRSGYAYGYGPGYAPPRGRTQLRFELGF